MKILIKYVEKAVKDNFNEKKMIIVISLRGVY